MLLFCDVCGERLLAEKYTFCRVWEGLEHAFCSFGCLEEWLGRIEQPMDPFELFRGSNLELPDWLKKGKEDIVKELKEEELELVARVEKALEDIVSFDEWSWCAGLHLFDYSCFKGAVELWFDFEYRTITLTYCEDYSLSFLPGKTLKEMLDNYKAHVNWMEEEHRRLELRKFFGYFVEGEGVHVLQCDYTKEYSFDQVEQLVKDLKYLLYAEEEPEENITIGEFDWDYFEEVTGKMRERIENETPFKYGATRSTDSGFSFELLDERGLGSGIELYENFKMEIGLIYTLGGYEINKSFRFSEVDGNRIVEHLRKLHEQILDATYY